MYSTMFVIYDVKITYLKLKFFMFVDIFMVYYNKCVKYFM